MFRMGQQILVTRSNLEAPRHPSVGDQGFLGNVFLFPLERFIIAEILFYLYLNNPGNRCERKIVVVDLDKNSGYGPFPKMRQTSRLMNFLCDEHSAINLCSPTPHCLRTNDAFTYRILLWPWFGRRNTDNLNEKSSLSVIEFRPVDLPGQLTSSTGVVCAWINSMRTLFLDFNDDSEHMRVRNRVQALIKSTKPMGGYTAIYANPKQKKMIFAKPWFEDKHIVEEIIWLIRRLEAGFRKNKRNALELWMKQHSFDKDTRTSMYQYYINKMDFAGELYRGIHTDRVTREMITELYFLVLSSSSIRETEDLVLLFGKHLLEIRGDYYEGHYHTMAADIIDDQTKIMKGEKSITDLFKTKYLK